LWFNNEIGDDKNEGELMAILIAVAMQWYDVGRIASTDRAHPGLHWKPVDASIGKVPAPYCPSGPQW
jgi:hypothetical protein